MGTDYMNHHLNIKENCSLIIYYYIVALTIFGMVSTSYSLVDMSVLILNVNINIFDLGLLGILAISIPSIFPRILNEKGANKIVYLLIILYLLYQIVVVAPLTFLDQESTLNIRNIFRRVTDRSFFIIVPFISFFIIPRFSSITQLYRPFYIGAAVILIVGVYRLVTGDDLQITNTGQLRSLESYSTFIFAFLMISNLSLLGAKKTNVFYLIMGLTGIILSAHRSAFLAIGFVLSIGIIINISRNKSERKSYFYLTILLIVLLLLSQIPFISEYLTGRFLYTFDYQDHNVMDRMMNWRAAWNYFLLNPINGSLLKGQWYDAVYGAAVFYEPHNFLFELLAAQGIVGTFFHVSILLVSLKTAYNNRMDGISLQMLFILLYYILFSSLNVTYANSKNILILVFSIAMILSRNRNSAAYYSHLVSQGQIPSSVLSQ